TLIQVEPVVGGDLLLTVQDQTLQAFDLKTRRLLWQVPGTGPSLRPPVVAGDGVLWATSVDQATTLFALDRVSGAERWRDSLPRAGPSTGALASNGPAFVGSPPSAYDLATGALRWQIAANGTPLGGPALAPDGSVLYVGLIQPNNAGGSVLALDAA